MGYKAVVFDLGGVVLGSPFEAIADFEKKFSLPHNFVNHCIKHFGERSAFAKYEQNQISPKDFHQAFISDFRKFAPTFASKTKIDLGNLAQNLKQITTENVAILTREMGMKASVLDRTFGHCLGVLRGRGFKTAALTNNFIHDDHKDDKTFPFLRCLFDEIVESAREGVRKPDPSFYRIVCEKLGTPPEEIVFLDDIGYNLKAAKELGMYAIKVSLDSKLEALNELHRVLDLPLDVSLIPKDGESCELFYDVGLKSGRIFVDCFGRFDDPLVFFLHGAGQTRHTWRSTAVALAMAGFCCLTIDMKGHGQSYWHPFDQLDENSVENQHPYSYDAYAKDLDSLIDYIMCGDDFRKPILVGASLGGLSIMRSESKFKAKGIVFVDIAPKMEISGVHRIVEFMKTTIERGFDSLEEAVEVVKAYNPRTKNKEAQSAPEAQKSIMKNLRIKDGRYYWHWDPKFIESPRLTEANALIVEKLLLDDLREVGDDLKRKGYSMPLLVRGKMTDVVSLEGVQNLRRVLPGLLFEDIEQAGHMVAGDQNDVFSETIISYCLNLGCPQPELTLDAFIREIDLQGANSRL